MLKKILVVIACIQFLLACQLLAQGFTGRTTLNFRGGFWRLKKNDDQTIMNATVGCEDIYADFKYSIGSGIDLFYWSSDGLAIGLTLGALLRGEGDDHIATRCDYYDSEWTTIEDYHRNLTIVPLVAGARLNILKNAESPLRPYLSGGGGLYWGIDTIHEGNISTEHDVCVDHRIQSSTETTLGGYLGGGLDIIIWRRGLLEFKSIRESDIGRSWFGNILGIGFGLNIDYRYHFINFDSPLWDRTHYSGSEFTFGFNLIFGKERSQSIQSTGKSLN